MRSIFQTQRTVVRKARIAIFCRQMKLGGDPFTEDYYWQAYQDLLLALKERGIEAYFASDNNSYRGGGLFKVAYTTDHKTTIDNLETVTDLQVDLVFDRGGFIGRNVATINPEKLLKWGGNKIEMYRHFGAFQPFSVICNTGEETIAAFEQIPGDKIVVKEPEGRGGKQVYIGTKSEIVRQLPDSFPLLVQEFVDTSGGVPGHMSGIHDVRLSVCGGRIIGYYIRSAKAGSYHSNVSRGGTMLFYEVSHVPRELRRVVRIIDAQFKALPRYYAIDFMHTEKGWKLVELNPYLALLPKTDGVEARKTLKALADYLAEQARIAQRRSMDV